MCLVLWKVLHSLGQKGKFVILFCAVALDGAFAELWSA